MLFLIDFIFAACLLKNEKPDYEKIVFYCREVMKCSSENPKTHFRMALALFELGDFNAALESCNEALRCGPSQGNSFELSKDRTNLVILVTPNLYFDTYNNFYLDSKITNLKTRCLEQLAKKSYENKIMYEKMLGFK